MKSVFFVPTGSIIDPKHRSFFYWCFIVYRNKSIFCCAFLRIGTYANKENTKGPLCPSVHLSACSFFSAVEMIWTKFRKETLGFGFRFDLVLKFPFFVCLLVPLLLLLWFWCSRVRFLLSSSCFVGYQVLCCGPVRKKKKIYATQQPVDVLEIVALIHFLAQVEPTRSTR